jgi:hypothetical protein
MAVTRVRWTRTALADIVAIGRARNGTFDI